MLHTLVCRISIMANTCAYSSKFIRRDAYAYRAAANQYTPVAHIMQKRSGNILSMVRIVIGLISIIRTKIYHLIPFLLHCSDEYSFITKTCVIRTNNDSHDFETIFFTLSTMFSTVNPKCLNRSPAG